MAVDQLLRKNFWLVVLPLVAIAALLNAQAVTQLVGIGLMPDEKALAAPPPVAKVAPMSSVVGQRNPTAEPDPRAQPVRPRDRAARPPAVDGHRGRLAPPLDTSDPWNAPVVRRREGAHHRRVERSGLVVRRRSAARATPSRCSVVAAARSRGKTVHFVGWDRVWFQNGSTLCQAQLFKQRRGPKRRGARAGRLGARPPGQGRRRRARSRAREGHPEGLAPPSSTSTAASSTRSSRTSPS